MAQFRPVAARHGGRIRRRASVEALEPRILLSADLPAALPVASALPPDVATLAEPLAAAAAELAAPAQNDDRRELVIVDAGVEGLEALLEDLRDAGRGFDVVLLDPDRDGVAQIGEALASYPVELDAVHVLSHGTDAGIQLGDAWLTRDNLAARAQDVAGWGAALTAEGDLLLYGCDLAGSADGRALVKGLAVLTGADVAASDDLTGSALLGGDWELEYRTGALETRVALGTETATTWSGVLGQLVHTSHESFDNQSEIKSDAQWGQSFRHTSGDGTYTVNEVALRLHREVDAVPQIITVSLRNSWNGPVLASASISSTTLGTAEAWHTFDLGSVELTDGQSYVLRVATNTTEGEVHLGFDSSSTYADGDRLDTNGSTIGGEDVAFRVSETTNDAPTLTPSAPTLPTLTEDDVDDAGSLISAVLGSSVSDLNAGALEGLAVTGLDSGNGTWEFSNDGGASWIAVGPVSETSALLLRASDRIRFVPDGENADAASFSFRAWDQTTGAAGAKVDVSTNGGITAFSAASDSASITVTAVNDAPVLTPGSPALPAIDVTQTNNAGALVSDLLGSSASDVDAGAVEGIAVTNLGGVLGSWEYSTDSGVSWNATGTVSDANALLLRASDRIRFVPNGVLPGAAQMTYRAWDQTSGAAGAKADASVNGGTTAFSGTTDTAVVTVAAVNLAPTLTPSAPTLPTLTEDDVDDAGSLISAVLGSSVSDLNPGALEGLAVTGLDSGNGTWEFSNDGGASWSAVGPVLETSALLLRASDRIRFVPDGENADAASFSFRAWDQTTGAAGAKVDVSTNGGITAFSAATDTASVAVSAVNDAPSLGDASLAAVAGDTVSPPGAPLSTLFAGGFADVDAGASFAGVAVVGNLADATVEGVWQYSSDGGASWSAIGSVSDGSGALALAADTLVRFVPASGASGAPSALVVRGLDDTYVGGFSSTGGGGGRVFVDTGSNGGTTAVAGGTSTVSTTVTAVPLDDLPVDDPPVDRLPLDDLLRDRLRPDRQPRDDTASPDAPPPRADEGDAPGTEPNPEEPPIVSEPLPDDGPEVPDAPPAPGSPETGPSTASVPSAPPVVEDATQREQEPEPAAAAGQRGMETLRGLLSRMAGTELSDLVFLNDDGGFIAELDELRDDAEAAVQLEAKLIGSTLAISTGLSVGYLIWLTRGGLLLASLLSTMPAWRLIDPVPILAQLRDEDDEKDRKDDESLDSLVRGESPTGRPDSVERAPARPEV